MPVVLLTGDDAACAEATAFNPAIRTISVKTSCDRFAAVLHPAQHAHAAIRDAAHQALTDIPRLEQLAPTTATLAVRWQSTTVASHLAAIPNVQRTDARTVRTSGPLPDLFRLFSSVFTTVASALTTQPPYT